MAREAVRLNIYDMYWINEYVSSIGVGVYHSGIEVYGVEYAYGGHPFAFSGIFENSPKDAEELGDNFRYRESVVLGYTDFTPEDILRLTNVLANDFSGDKYHLMNKNCNHFTAGFAKVLCGKDIPSWVNRLAFMSTCVPFLQRCLPQEWLTPVALQQTIDHRRNSTANTNAQIVSSPRTSPMSPVNASLPLTTSSSSTNVSSSTSNSSWFSKTFSSLAPNSSMSTRSNTQTNNLSQNFDALQTKN